MENLRFEPHCSPCHMFRQNGEESIRTAWIVPIRIRKRGSMPKVGSGECELMISWRCSLGYSCENFACIYAKGENAKEKNE